VWRHRLAADDCGADSGSKGSETSGKTGALASKARRSSVLVTIWGRRGQYRAV
jgi:hypothetical protein